VFIAINSKRVAYSPIAVLSWLDSKARTPAARAVRKEAEGMFVAQPTPVPLTGTKSHRLRRHTTKADMRELSTNFGRTGKV